LHQQFPQQVNVEGAFITSIKANFNDSAAFDTLSNKMFTWGSFGQMKLNFATEKKRPQFTPSLFELDVITDRTEKLYAYN
jgi:hypothetical protein